MSHFWRFLVIIIGFILIFNELPCQASKIILYTDNDSYGKSKEEKIWHIALGQHGFANFFDLKVP